MCCLITQCPLALPVVSSREAQPLLPLPPDARMPPTMLPAAASSQLNPASIPIIRLAAIQKTRAPLTHADAVRLNPHRSRTLPAVSFFEGFQTPAGPQKTRAHSCGRHLKPITIAESLILSITGQLYFGNRTRRGCCSGKRRASVQNRYFKAPFHPKETVEGAAKRSVTAALSSF